MLKYEKFKQQILRERQALIETVDELKAQIDAKTSDLLSYSTESKIEALDRMARLESDAKDIFDQIRREILEMREQRIR